MIEYGKPVRVGVIGIGFGQRAHVPAFSAVPGCDVVALCATSHERAARVAERLGVPVAYGDWHDLVADPEIDAVTISTPPVLQAEIAAAALQRGKAVFCEKPLATSPGEAERLTLLAQQTGAANMLDFELPEIAAWCRAKAILDQGGIGPLRHIAVNWYVETYASRMRLNSWKNDPAAGGGTLNSFVSHVFHYIEWFAGKIEALSVHLCHAPGDSSTSDTLIVAVLLLESGVPVAVSVSSNAFLGNGHRVAFYGSDGTLILENNTADYANGFQLHCGIRLTGRLERVEVDAADAGQADEDGRVPLVTRLATRFVHWIHQGVPAKPDFADGLRVQRLIAAAQRSQELGTWVHGPF